MPTTPPVVTCPSHLLREIKLSNSGNSRHVGSVNEPTDSSDLITFPKENGNNDHPRATAKTLSTSNIEEAIDNQPSMSSRHDQITTFKGKSDSKRDEYEEYADSDGVIHIKIKVKETQERMDIDNSKLRIIGGGRVQPHFCPWKNLCFSIFPHGEKWEKKYMERKGKVFISLSFHILFSPWKKWENTHFSMGKNGVGPPPPPIILFNFLSSYSGTNTYFS